MGCLVSCVVVRLGGKEHGWVLIASWNFGFNFKLVKIPGFVKQSFVQILL